jgi:glyoxylase-like metal-dependent hydrolase (beta-lactamase superfamily II)
MEFVRDMTFEYGVAEEMAPGVRRVVARNPGAFTYHGTGTYIVGRGRVAVVDPGPDLSEHVDALLAALEGETVGDILITHTHLDHSPAARRLKDATGATVHGMTIGARLGPESEVAMEEGVDRAFTPDRHVRHADVIQGDGWTMEALHTPGHIANHFCYAHKESASLFSGDHVMGWSTTVVVPPLGDMADYMASLAALLDREDRILWPTHGPPVTRPRDHVEGLIEHRRGRERQILEGLRRGPTTIPRLVEVIYADVPKTLHAAAGCSVLAHLIDLAARGLVACDGPPSPTSTFRLA